MKMLTVSRAKVKCEEGAAVIGQVTGAGRVPSGRDRDGLPGRAGVALVEQHAADNAVVAAVNFGGLLNDIRFTQ